MKKKKCVFCGEMIPQGTKVCPVCGETLPASNLKTEIGTKQWIFIAVVGILSAVASYFVVSLLNPKPDYYEITPELSENVQTPRNSSPESNTSNDSSSEGSIYEEYEDDDIPEAMWTPSTFVGELTGNGHTYPIELFISYPMSGKFRCRVVGSYRYKGHTGLISLEGDWMELAMGRIVVLCLNSDEYLERFDLDFDGNDLLSTKKLTGTWSKFSNHEDYSTGSNPTKKLSVTLTVKTL